MLREWPCKTAAIFAAVLMLELVSVASLTAADAQNDGVEAQTEHGKATYAQRCSHCHGPNLINSGTITPDLRSFPDDKARFVSTVKQGKNNRMPPWGDILNDDEITDLWAYISSRRRQ